MPKPLQKIDDVSGLMTPCAFRPPAEITAWHEAFLDDWRWFDRGPARVCRLRPAQPFELRLHAEALADERVAAYAYVLVIKAGSYLLRLPFRPELADEDDIDCEAVSDAAIEKKLARCGHDLAPVRRMREEYAAYGEMDVVDRKTHLDLLFAAIPHREEASPAALAAAARLRGLMIGDAIERDMMARHPAVDFFLRRAAPFEPVWDGYGVTACSDRQSIAFARPGGVLARIVGMPTEQ